MVYLLKMVIFHGYVSSPEGIKIVPICSSSPLNPRLAQSSPPTPSRATSTPHKLEHRLSGKENIEKAINGIWLVVSIPLKNMKVSWDDYSQYMEK